MEAHHEHDGPKGKKIKPRRACVPTAQSAQSAVAHGWDAAVVRTGASLPVSGECASTPAGRANPPEPRGSGSDLLQTRPFPDERGSPLAAPLLAISRVSGVGWLVVVVIASLAAPGHHPLPTQAVAVADWMSDHGHFAPGPDTRLDRLDLPAMSFDFRPDTPPDVLVAFSARY